MRIGLWESQRLDPVSQLVQPWFTHSALDEIQEWALHEKVVLEWGGGHSSLWWATRCRHVYTIESDLEWCQWIAAQAALRGIVNISIFHRESESSLKAYLQIPRGCRPDIIVIDGATRRLECLETALYIPKPVTIIFDNWQQKGAFMSPQAEALMSPFPGTAYAQADRAHLKHSWQTAIWHLA